MTRRKYPTPLRRVPLADDGDFCCPFQPVEPVEPVKPVKLPAIKLILDTDMGGGACRDVDDVVALCISHALMDNGEAELLAVVQDTAPPPCAGVISVINHWYGRDDIPIGAYKGSGLTLAGNPPLSYVSSMLRNFPSPIKDSSQVPDAVAVYRRVLASSPPQSVTISSVGLQTNLELLLRSGPDAHSNLTGIELVKEKVVLLAAMAGSYPRSHWSECNACGCFNGADLVSKATAAAATAYVAENMPRSVRVIYLGYEDGERVRTGAALEECAAETNPCRHALMEFRDNAHWGWARGGRSSWDPLATLLAVRGVSQKGMGLSDCVDCDGTNHINKADGSNYWVAGPPSNQSYVRLKDIAIARRAIDELLCQPRLADRPRSPPLSQQLAHNSDERASALQYTHSRVRNRTWRASQWVPKGSRHGQGQPA